MADRSEVVSLDRLRVSCRLCTLSELCLPRNLDDADLDHLDRVVQRGRALERGEHLYEVRDPFQSLYAVRSGTVKAYATTEDGGEQVLGFHLAGDLIGFDGFENGYHSCAAIALETTSVCTLPTDQIETLCSALPGLQREIFRVMGREIGADQAMLLLLGKRSADARIASFLLSLSRRFEQRGFSSRAFNLSMSRHDIGNYLGLALETVSRQFARFQEEGLVRVERRAVELHDLDRLRAIAGEPDLELARRSFADR